MGPCDVIPLHDRVVQSHVGLVLMIIATNRSVCNSHAMPGRKRSTATLVLPSVLTFISIYSSTLFSSLGGNNVNVLFRT